MRFDAGRARPALAGGAAPRGRRAPVVMAVSNRADLRPVGERSPRPFRARGSLGADARKGLFGRAGGLDRRADRVERPCDRGNGVLDPGATRSFHDRAQRQILLPAMRADPGGRPEGRGAALDLLVFRAWRPALGARKAADGEFSSRKRSRTPRSARQTRRPTPRGKRAYAGFSGRGPGRREAASTRIYEACRPPNQPRKSLRAGQTGASLRRSSINYAQIPQISALFVR